MKVGKLVGWKHADAGNGRYTYLKIKVKIKPLQKLKLNIFLAKIKYYLEKNLSKFAKKIGGNRKIFENLKILVREKNAECVDLGKC